MNKWASDARIAATRKFCEKLDLDADLREACKTQPETAWRTLNEAGDFEDMPADVRVYVFENKPDSSDKVVTLVLPAKGELGPADTFDASGVWYCSWPHYLE